MKDHLIRWSFLYDKYLNIIYNFYKICIIIIVYKLHRF